MNRNNAQAVALLLCSTVLALPWAQGPLADVLRALAVLGAVVSIDYLAGGRPVIVTSRTKATA